MNRSLFVGLALVAMTMPAHAGMISGMVGGYIGGSMAQGNASSASEYSGIPYECAISRDLPTYKACRSGSIIGQSVKQGGCGSMTYRPLDARFTEFCNFDKRMTAEFEALRAAEPAK